VTPVKVAIDTNVLACAEGTNGAAMKDAALSLLHGLPAGTAVLAAQTLGELFNVLVRKGGRQPAAAREAVQMWADAYPVYPTSAGVIARATDQAVDHKLGIWEAVVLSAAAEAGCRLLISEDLQNGFTWQGVTVANPFTPDGHPLLKALLTGPAEG